MEETSTKNIPNKTKTIFRISIMIILVTLAVLFFILAFTTNNRNLVSALYINKINKDVDYKVYLYNNSFIQEEYLKKNEMYISDLVKSIESVFKYNFNTSKIKDLSYEYEIIATIQGIYKSSNEDTTSNVWNKSYKLVEKKSNNVTQTTSFNVNETVTIDYVKYNKEVSEFRKSLKLPLDATLKVTMNVRVTSKNIDNTDNVEDDSTVQIDIPLNQLAFKILDKYEPSVSKTVTKDGKSSINYIYLTIGIILLLSVIYLITFVKAYKELVFKKNKDKFEAELDKILKQYGEIIVETLNDQNIANKNVIQVINFNEMIDLEEELRIPILLYEAKDKKEAYFTIVHDDIVYRYIFKGNSENK